jgi:Tfp pilus assembly protein PilV
VTAETTAKQIVDALMHRLKTNEMQFYDVKHEVGSGWLPRGTIPFHITVRNGVATFKVYALSQVDAEDQVSSWLEQLELDDPDE